MNKSISKEQLTKALDDSNEDIQLYAKRALGRRVDEATTITKLKLFLRS